MRAGQWIVSLIDSHIGILVLCGEHGRESAVDAVAYAHTVAGMSTKPIRALQCLEMSGAAVFAIC